MCLVVGPVMRRAWRARPVQQETTARREPPSWGGVLIGAGSGCASRSVRTDGSPAQPGSSEDTVGFDTELLELHAGVPDRFHHHARALPLVPLERPLVLR
jgi:hypothetical protein